MRDIDPTASEFISSSYLERSRPGGVLYDIKSIAGAAGSFFGGPVGGAIGSTVGGLLQDDAASDGLAAQQQGASQADATQRYIFDRTRADNAPFMQAGTGAINRLAYLAGVGGSVNGKTPASSAASISVPTTYQNGQTNDPIWEAILSKANAEHAQQFGIPINRPWNADSGVSNLYERLANEYRAQVAANNKATEVDPTTDPEYGSLTRGFTEAAPELRKFGQSDLDSDLVYQNGLQFGLDEGRKGIDRQASARGSALSGATLKALTRFGNDYATTKTAGAYDRFDNEQRQGYGRYVDRYNRFNADNDNTFNRLSAIAGRGQTASSQVGAAGQSYGRAVSENALGMGNATAASGIARANNLQGTINRGISGLNNSPTNSLANLYDDGYSLGQGTSYGGNYSRM